MKTYNKNKKLLSETYNYNQNMEHDACGVGMVATTDGKKSRKIVEYGIEALKASIYGPTRVLCGKVFLHVIFMHFLRGS